MVPAYAARVGDLTPPKAANLSGRSFTLIGGANFRRRLPAVLQVACRLDKVAPRTLSEPVRGSASWRLLSQKKGSQSAGRASWRDPQPASHPLPVRLPGLEAVGPVVDEVGEAEADHASA